MEWKDLTGKKVFIRTKHDKVYSGIINSVKEIEDLTFLNMTDKFGQKVVLVANEIVELAEEDVK